MSIAQPHISIVSPVYGAEALVSELVRRVAESVEPLSMDYEIVLVVDGSPDNSWDRVKEVASQNPKVKGINLSRNFGQHQAITAGLDHCTGKWVVVMDCDLQDRPEEIPALYRHAQTGFDAVFARRAERQDTFFKRFFSKSFYRLLSYLTDTPQDAAIANFGIYHSKVIDVLRSMREQTRYFPVMVRWAGFNTSAIDVKHASRTVGETSYTFGKAMSLAFSVMLNFSDKPLRLLVRFGVVVSSVSFIIGIITFVSRLLGKITEPGWASLMISIWFLSGVIIVVLGMVGLYVGKAFEEGKKRPIYIVDEIVEQKASQ